MITLNGRFLTMPVTGTQRYARELSLRLPAALGEPITALVPPLQRRALEGTLPEPDSDWAGAKGHLWEQLVLPGLAAGSDLLLSLAGTGPAAVHRQVLVVHDAAPFLYPEFYRPSYLALIRRLLPGLARRSLGVVVSSARLRGDVRNALGISGERVTAIPPGVGTPFTDTDGVEPNGYCVFVGGHDPRKNLPFILELWPRVGRAHGLELVVVSRQWSGPHRQNLPSESDHVRLVVSPTDRELGELYAGARWLLWPSAYEGFGLPLLEAMATGTPFLATDVGAASELAVDHGRQVLPLDPDAWTSGIASDPTPLRAPSRAKALSYTWERAAQSLADLVRRVRE